MTVRLGGGVIHYPVEGMDGGRLRAGWCYLVPREIAWLVFVFLLLAVRGDRDGVYP